MSWIKPFAESTFNINSGNTIDAFQPLDFFHFYPLWYDLWVKKICQAITILELEKKSFAECKHFLPTPSAMRAILQKTISAYKGLLHKNPNEHKKMAEFFVRMLNECCAEDPFGLTSNPIYSKKEVDTIVNTTPWQTGNSADAKQIGKLIAATGSLVHGLYNDLVTDSGWDTYGPFLSGENRLLIRDFPDLRLTEIWDAKFLPQIKELKIFGLYQGVEWKIACVGCHTLVTSGDPITGLKKYSVQADGKELNSDDIKNITNEFSQKAVALYKEIRTKNFEELKKMVLLQEHYSLHKLFTTAGMDWKPSQDFYNRIDNKPLLTGLIPHGKLMTTVDEYIEAFNIDFFAQEVLGINL